MRLVQWNQRDQLFEVAKDFGIHAHRLGISEAAMDDAMANARQLALAATVFNQKPTQVFDRSFVAELDAFAPGLFADKSAVGGFGYEPRRSVESFGLSTKDEFQAATLGGEDAELDARGASI